MFSQVIYQLRLPGDCKFFTFKCSVNVTIKKKKKKKVCSIIFVLYLICSQFTLSLPPENIRKPLGALVTNGLTFSWFAAIPKVMDLVGYRSSCSREFCIICVLKKFFWRPATLLKKRLQHRCFPVNIAKFLRTAFFYRTPLVATSMDNVLYVLFS